MVDFARRLAGLLVALVLAAGLPLAAARAGCLCDHGHAHGAGAAAEHHKCTADCTAATCPMHRRAARASHSSAPPTRDGMRCSCAGDSQALLAQAVIAGVLPAVVTLDAPVFAPAPYASLAETPLRLAASPPAPPPRA